jgi:hypothetical protein
MNRMQRPEDAAAKVQAYAAVVHDATVAVATHPFGSLWLRDCRRSIEGQALSDLRWQPHRELLARLRSEAADLSDRVAGS